MGAMQGLSPDSLDVWLAQRDEVPSAECAKRAKLLIEGWIRHQRVLNIVSVGTLETQVEACVAASRALHAPAQKSVARYDIDADHWWEVPTERQWREVMGFDWRDARQVAAVSAAAFTRAMREDLPAHRYGQVWEVPNRKLDFTTRYITEDDYVKGGDGLHPDSERCRHGRNHRGCLPGFGVQRNGRGARIAAPRSKTSAGSPDRCSGTAGQLLG